MIKYFILNEDHTVREVSFEEYSDWDSINEFKRRIARTELPSGILISTVFLGLDHNFGDEPPILFETMAFAHGNVSEDLCQQRYNTYDEAIEGHNKVVEEMSK